MDSLEAVRWELEVLCCLFSKFLFTSVTVCLGRWFSEQECMQGSVLGQQLCSSCTPRCFSRDWGTCCTASLSNPLWWILHGERIAVTESLSRDLIRVSMWCDLWGMKLNESKTKTMIVSRSRTIIPIELY